MALISANLLTCKKDGACCAVCPMNLIVLGEGGVPTQVANIDGLCIRCGHCVAVCTTGSLQHEEIPLEQCPPLQKELFLTLEQSEQFFRSRRSIRNYRDKAIPRETLQRLFETVSYAPSGHNTQGAEWLVISDRKELNWLIGLIEGWMLDAMPIRAMSIHIDEVIERLDAGEDVILRGAPALIIAHCRKDDRMSQTTCTIALSHLELAATGLGLGGCWAGYFNAAASNYPPLREALNLPEGHLCQGAMMLGYPQYQYYRIPERKAPVITWR